jgi:hypothetical protein
MPGVPVNIETEQNAKCFDGRVAVSAMGTLQNEPDVASRRYGLPSRSFADRRSLTPTRSPDANLSE